jgi:hypothetical protein
MAFKSGLGPGKRLALLVALILLIPSALHAQTVTDPRFVEFEPSPDHDTVEDGLNLVTSYVLQIYPFGGSSPIETVDLGKPSPGSGGLIRVDFVSRLSEPLPGGVVYEARAAAVGPGGVAPSDPTNAFTFTVTCAPAISPTSRSMPAAAGSSTVGVTAADGCTWSAASNNTSWLSVTGGASGSGDGTVTFAVTANTGTSSRTGTLTVAGRTFTVMQSGVTSCSYSVSPLSQSVGWGGSGGSANVTTASGCAWTAASNASWITVGAGSTGSGNGRVSFTVAPNQSGARTGTLTIAGRTFTVNQAASPCSFSVSPTSFTAAAAGRTGTVNVTTTASCSWNASSSVSWIVATGTRSGSGSIGFTVRANTGGARTGTFTVAGRTVTVTQGAANRPTAPSNLRIVR